MKKIAWGLVLVVGGFLNITLAQGITCDGTLFSNDTKCCPTGYSVLNDKECCEEIQGGACVTPFCENGKTYSDAIGPVNYGDLCCEGEIYQKATLSRDCCKEGKHIFYNNAPDKTAKINGDCITETSFCSKMEAYADDVPAGGSINGYSETEITTFIKNFCTETPSTNNTSNDVGITCDKDQLVYGQCKFDVYDTLGIRQSDTETSVGIFVQDIILSATMFIGTIVTVAIVISGLMFVFGGANPGLQDKAKKGLINAIKGLVLVMSSYVVIRLIQFIVKGE